ncbi:right-handed parallel beta-helix repeat-containing protein [Aquimarina pacifica]|uniref:right-handed parallel beta-helix repeat-containing protein n=1 Tax=Aquimarina pacifica TaxID=1296415 RepID=UPI00047030B8|nr:right-handed parallel beta-helix repeat-containing protein [Aquimarina pacifica]
MKNLPNFVLFILYLLFLFSCSQENLDDLVPLGVDEVTEENIDEEGRPEDEEGEEIIPEEPENVETTPCDYDLANATANSVIVLDCVVDLNGQTVTLPNNVDIQFEGGDIVNGTLKFPTSSVTPIDGRILNSSLTIEGSVELKDPTFYFYAVRWGIIEGKTSDEISQSNKDILQELIYYIKDIGGNTFFINAMDAYFKVDVPLSVATPERAAITIPSDYTFHMTDNTHIRMQPNAYIRPSLMSVTENNSNVVIKGGNLYGDRDTHDYSDGATHAWGHLLKLKGCHNVTVEGVNFEDAMGDGLNIAGLYHYFESTHIPSEFLTIRGNTFKNCRRISLSITSGNDITIDNNTFIDGGIDTALSDGEAPASNINIEPVRIWEGGSVGVGNLKEYEKVMRVYIINNTQIGEGEFLASHADGPIVFDNNTMESPIAYTVANGVEITNNTFNYNPDLVAGSAISAVGPPVMNHPLVFDNVISGNKIYGYSTGISLNGNFVTVSDNYIEANTGIVLSSGSGEGLADATVSGNTIKAEQYGIRGTKLLENVTVSNNEIEGKSFPLYMNGVNDDSGQESAKVYVTGNFLNKNRSGQNTYDSKISNITLVNGLELTENQSNGGYEIIGSENLVVSGNVISSTTTHGFDFMTSATTNSEFSGNEITVASNKNCINERVSLSSSVTFSNNDCM